MPLVAEKPVTLLVPRGSADKLAGKVVYAGPLMAPLDKGAQVAQLKLFRGTTEVLSMPLKTAEAVPVGSLPHRALDAGLELVTGLVRQNFTKSK